MTEQVEKVVLERLINIGVGAVLNHPSNRITISHEALAIALPAILAATPPDDSVARRLAMKNIPGQPEYMNKPARERTDLEFVDWVRNHMPVAGANPSKGARRK